MTKTLYDFQNYKEYLNSILEIAGKSRGLRARLAEALNCQSAFISKVLNADAHFSIESAVLISEFLEHSPEEQHYFLLLVQLGRAGSRKLELYYEKQIERIRHDRRQIKKRVVSEEARPLSLEEKAIYYSSWLYVAIHVAVSVQGRDTKAALAEHFQLKLHELSRYLEFLVSAGILAEKAGHYRVGSRLLHLGHDSIVDSSLLAKHHTNWRLRAIESLDRQASQDLHFSSVISFSARDIEKIREVLLKSVEEVDEVIKPSPEETAFCLAIDFFRV